MPTTRRRHLITETDPVAVALDDAAAHWPDEPRRARLVVRLLEEGHRAIRRAEEDQRRRRLAAVRDTSGALTGSYRPDEVAHQREDWPE